MSVITLSPTTALRNETVTVSGTGLVPHIKLRLLVNGVVDTYNSRFRASSKGTFTIGYLVPASATYGTHKLRIQSLVKNITWTNEGSELALTVTQVVVPPPVEPPPVLPDPNAVGTNKLIGCLWDGINFNTLKDKAPDGPVQTSPVAAASTILDFNWLQGTPSTLVGIDTFSARWKGNFVFAPGTYTFTGGSDDGMRVRFNGVTQLDRWVDRSYTTNTFTKVFAEQTPVLIEIDFYENGGDARVSFGWTSVVTPPVEPPPTQTVPVAPTGLKATSGDKLIGLSWGVVSLAVSYKIYRDNVAIGTSTSPSFTNTGLTNSQSYSFKISAVNAVGEGPFSNIVNATPNAPSSGTFLSYPTRSPFTIQNTNDVELSNFTIKDYASVGITLRGVKRAFIHHVDLANLVGGIYLDSCEDIIIEDVRGRNIGDNTIGSGHSNYIQFATTIGGAIRRCKFLGGLTEDMISTWHSGGRSAANPLLIEDNQLQGLVNDTSTAKAWTSDSGTGIIVSDGAGHAYNGNITIRRNMVLTPGQVGIQLIDGPNIKVYSNIVYCQPRTGSNVGMSSWEGTPYAEVYSNQVRWYKADNSENPYWWINPSVINEHDNNWHANIDPNSLVITL